MNEIKDSTSLPSHQVLVLLRTSHHEGLQHLQHAQYAQAARSFSNGLGLINRDLGDVSSQQMQLAAAGYQEQREGVAFVPFQFAPEALVGQQDPAFHATSNVDAFAGAIDECIMSCGSSHEHPYIFNHPLLLREDVLNQAHEGLVTNEEWMESLSCAFLFNLALTYHLRSMAAATTENQRKKLVAAALTLYSTALKLLVSDTEMVDLSSMSTTKPSDTMTTEQTDTIAFTTDYYAPVVLVIYNNMGHIHNMLGNTADATACFQRVLSTMAYFLVVVRRHDVVETRAQYADEMLLSKSEGLIANVLPLILQPRKFAPAA